MLEAFYHLDTEPFRLNPNAGPCFLHRGYLDARAYIEQALLRGEGLTVLTGLPGTGKTTLTLDLLGSLSPDHVVTARLVSTQVQAEDLVRLIASGFGVRCEGLDRAQVLAGLEAFLRRQAEQGMGVLLVVDEAQALSGEALKELCLLRQLSEGGRPLLRVLLVGQDPLKDLLASLRAAEICTGLTALYGLAPLHVDETRAYIEHRLRLAGWRYDPRLGEDVFFLVYRFSQGIPRHINRICSRLLLHGAVEQRHELDGRDVVKVCEELRAELLASPSSPPCTALTDPDLGAAAVQRLGVADGARGTDAGLVDNVRPLFLASAPGTAADPFPTLREEGRGGGGAAADDAWPHDAKAGVGVRPQKDRLPRILRCRQRSPWPGRTGLGALAVVLVAAALAWLSATRPPFLSSLRRSLDARVVDMTRPRHRQRAGPGVARRQPPTVVATTASVPVQASSATARVAEPPRSAAVPPQPVRAEPAPAEALSEVARDLRALGLKVQRPDASTLVLDLRRNVTFAFDSADIPPGSRPVLSAIAGVLVRHTAAGMVVLGYTDASGAPAYNLRLSQRRAEAVAAYLVAKGVSSERVRGEGRGESEPVTGASGPLPRSLSRRVEILIEPMVDPSG